MMFRAIRSLPGMVGVGMKHRQNRTITSYVVGSRSNNCRGSGLGLRLFSNSQVVVSDETSRISNPQTVDEYIKAGNLLLAGGNAELYAIGRSYLAQAEKLELAQTLEQMGIKLPADLFEYVSKAKLLEDTKIVSNNCATLKAFKQVVENLEENAIQVVWLLERIQTAQFTTEINRLQTNDENICVAASVIPQSKTHETKEKFRMDEEAQIRDGVNVFLKKGVEPNRVEQILHDIMADYRTAYEQR